MTPETLVWLRSAFWGLVVVVFPYIVAPVGCLLICRKIKRECLRQAREAIQAAEIAWTDASFLYLLGVRAENIAEGVDRESALRLLYHNPDLHQEGLHYLAENRGFADSDRNRRSSQFPWGIEVKKALSIIHLECLGFPASVPNWMEGHLRFLRATLGKHKEPPTPRISRFQREHSL
jgi:hypothetical protein